MTLTLDQVKSYQHAQYVYDY